MIPSTQILIRLDGRFSHVGSARIEQDPKSGMTLLRLDLTAMAPRLYVPLQDVQVLFDEERTSSVTPIPVLGHA